MQTHRKFFAALFVTLVALSLQASAKGNRSGAAKTCDDINVQFDDHDVVRSEEKLTVPLSGSAFVLKAAKNGGVNVYGGAGSSYSVTLCKFAEGDRSGNALLGQIRPLLQGSELTVQGPEGESHWTAFLIIQAPANSNMDVSATNGPIDARDYAGKLNVRAKNGPVNVTKGNGDFKIETVNGPIHFTGTGGNLAMNAQNGPISVELAGESWDNGNLEAHAENGPLELQVPPNFHSAFLIESDGHSPMSCRASICDQARKTWDDEHKRIEFGGSNPAVRLSTSNGPVAVVTRKSEM